LKEALRRTIARRPELLEGRAASREESKLLAEVRDELASDAAGGGREDEG
jgi:tRNA G37 N-methylase TrmD